jgi:hypothetical protein
MSQSTLPKVLFIEEMNPDWECGPLPVIASVAKQSFRKASCQGLLRRRRLAMTGYGDSMPVKQSFFIDQTGSE